MNKSIDLPLTDLMNEELKIIDIDVVDHSPFGTNIMIGEIEFFVSSKIEIDREPRTEWTYWGGHDREEIIGIDYDASVEIESINLKIGEHSLAVVTLPDVLIARVAAAIAEQAEQQAEEQDEEDALNAYEASSDFDEPF